MITVKDDRWITANPAEANEAAVKKRCRIAQVFHTMEDAEAWLEDILPALVPITHSDSDSDSDSEDEDSVPTVEEVKRMSALVRRRRKKQAQKARKRQSTSGRNASSGHSTSTRKSSTKGGQKKAQSGRRSSTGRGHMDVSLSDPSSSSDSESKSDESSNSSTLLNAYGTPISSSGNSSNAARRQQSSRRHKKGKNKKARKDKNKKSTTKNGNHHQYQHDDPSTKDPQRIYGMSINGLAIDKEVALNSMRRADRGSMYTAAVDVTSLPGGWNSNKGGSEELFQESQKIAQLTSTILASTNNTKGLEIQDTSWNSALRHSLGKIKSREDLFEFVCKL
jgi:hypothetical protein